jgi:SAM-dependent methyltransferase
MNLSEEIYESGLLREVTGPALRPGGTFLTDRAASFCGFVPGCRLLDVGCGTGATVEHLRDRYGIHVTGLDCSRILLDEALRRNPLLTLVEGRAEALPCPDGTIDGIFCECVLSLLAAPRQALGEFRRVLAPGGYLVLSDLYDRPEQGAQPCGSLAGGVRAGRATREALEELVRTCGFSVLFWEDHTRFLKELAARLILAGCPLDEFYGTGCSGRPLSVGPRPGYYLMVGRREG